MVYILIFFLLTWENFYIFWANVVANISSAALWRKAIFNFTDRCRLMLYYPFFDQGIWLIICRDLIMGWAACSRIVKFLLDPMIFFWLCTCWTYTSWKTTPCVCTSNIYFTLLVVLYSLCRSGDSLFVYSKASFGWKRWVLVRVYLFTSKNNRVHI